MVPHNFHCNQNGCVKYDHKLMYKKYTTPLPYYGMWGSRKTFLDGSAKKVIQSLILPQDGAK